MNKFDDKFISALSFLSKYLCLHFKPHYNLFLTSIRNVRKGTTAKYVQECPFSNPSIKYISFIQDVEAKISNIMKQEQINLVNKRLFDKVTDFIESSRVCYQVVSVVRRSYCPLVFSSAMRGRSMRAHVDEFRPRASLQHCRRRRAHPRVSI